MTAAAVRSASVADVHAAQQEGTIDLVDVRQPGEFASFHASGARSIPLGQVTAERVRTSRPAEATGPTYVICLSGGRSRQACAKLAGEGLEVVNVEGGSNAWRAAGLPIESQGGGGGGLPNSIRLLGLFVVVASLGLSLTVAPAFAFVALGVWVALLVANRGACPLGTCAPR